MENHRLDFMEFGAVLFIDQQERSFKKANDVIKMLELIKHG